MTIRQKSGAGQDSAHGAPVAYEARHRGWFHDDDTRRIGEVHVRIAEQSKGHASAGQTYAPVRVVVSQRYVTHASICLYLEALRSEFVLCLDERAPQTAGGRVQLRHLCSIQGYGVRAESCERIGFALGASDDVCRYAVGDIQAQVARRGHLELDEIGCERCYGGWNAERAAAGG